MLNLLLFCNIPQGLKRKPLMDNYKSINQTIDSLLSAKINTIIVYKYFSQNTEINKIVFWKDSNSFRAIKYDTYGAYIPIFFNEQIDSNNFFDEIFSYYSENLKSTQLNDTPLYDKLDSNKYFLDHNSLPYKHIEVFEEGRVLKFSNFSSPFIYNWEKLIISKLDSVNCNGAWYVLDSKGNSYRIARKK